MAADSTNQQDFRRFLELLKVAVKPELAGPGKQKPICLLGKLTSFAVLTNL
jgi:hypothetical protein